MANEVFDKVADGTKKAATVVAETAEELWDKGKIKAAEIQTKGEIKEEFRKLGEITYNCAKSGSDLDDTKAESINKLDELNAKLLELQAALAAKKEQNN